MSEQIPSNGPDTAEIVGEYMPDLMAEDTGENRTVFGVTAPYSTLIKLCPIPLENMTIAQKNEFIIIAENVEGAVVRPDRAEYYDQVLAQRGLESKFTVGIPAKPIEQPVKTEEHRAKPVTKPQISLAKEAEPKVIRGPEQPVPVLTQSVLHDSRQESIRKEIPIVIQTEHTVAPPAVIEKEQASVAQQQDHEAILPIATPARENNIIQKIVTEKAPTEPIPPISDPDILAQAPRTAVKAVPVDVVPNHDTSFDEPDILLKDELVSAPSIDYQPRGSEIIDTPQTPEPIRYEYAQSFSGLVEVLPVTESNPLTFDELAKAPLGSLDTHELPSLNEPQPLLQSIESQIDTIAFVHTEIEIEKTVSLLQEVKQIIHVVAEQTLENDAAFEIDTLPPEQQAAIIERLKIVSQELLENLGMPADEVTVKRFILTILQEERLIISAERIYTLTSSAEQGTHERKSEDWFVRFGQMLMRLQRADHSSIGRVALTSSPVPA